MVGAGATSDIVNDIKKFKNFDDSFQPETHSVEFADGTKCSGIAQQRGTTIIHRLDYAGRKHRAQLLYEMPYMCLHTHMTSFQWQEQQMQEQQSR